MGIYSREMKAYVLTKNCTQMSIAALFIVAMNWKTLRYPLTGEWLNQRWGSHTRECCSTERDKLLLHAATWVSLQGFMLLEKKVNPQSLHTV